MKSPCALVVFAILSINIAIAQAEVSVSRISGGSIQIKCGGFVYFNKESALEREWITLHDSSLPVDFKDDTGVRTQCYSEKYGLDMRYKACYDIDTKEPITAIEVKFILFDIWGDKLKILNSTDVADITDTKFNRFCPEWKELNDNIAAKYYASIAFISRVRTKTGKVIEADLKAIIEQARKFTDKFTLEDLEPKPEKE